ncbi:MAG: lipopolysaccharide biosynthesis protein [Bacteroidales bacterium]|jgi:hypothetical protein|nr:lipopolysaccharide biosynthesis protein [Bacteroidales bacterium]
MAYHFGSGKNSKLLYFTRNAFRMATPKSWLRSRLPAILAELENRPDREYIISRVNYYNRLSAGTVLPDDAVRLKDFRLKGNRSAYFFDSYEHARWFNPSLRWKYVFGDVTHVPEWPAIVKSRPVAGNNANSVLINLDKALHFTFLNDTTPFRSKSDRAIFRGLVDSKPHRIMFMDKYAGHPMVDAGITDRLPTLPSEWMKEKISLWKHLEYKFIMALEGLDVATNLKWVMSSNSVAVMPRPRYETWFMEGTLVPGYHYVEVMNDYSDLIEKMDYFTHHPDEAEQILHNAHEYISQFRNPQRERLIALLTLEKYFRMTGQL